MHSSNIMTKAEPQLVPLYCFYICIKTCQCVKASQKGMPRSHFRAKFSTKLHTRWEGARFPSTLPKQCLKQSQFLHSSLSNSNFIASFCYLFFKYFTTYTGLFLPPSLLNFEVICLRKASCNLMLMKFQQDLAMTSYSHCCRFLNPSWTKPTCASVHCWATHTPQNTLRKWVALLNVR